jgi:hypothetical protein
VFLTSVPGKEGFYARLGFLRQTNAMGWYTEAARAEALARGVLVADSGLASPPSGAISKGTTRPQKTGGSP